MSEEPHVRKFKFVGGKFINDDIPEQRDEIPVIKINPLCRNDLINIVDEQDCLITQYPFATFLWIIRYGQIPYGHAIEHINGDKLDN